MTNADEPRVGVIGLGQMGGAMCRTLLRRGWSVVAWDPLGLALDAAVGAGAEAATDPADVATRASIIITSVPDAEALRALAFGERGLVRGECAARILIDTSTVSPGDARSIAMELESRGVAFLDAPVSGGVRGAEGGQLAVMVGGSPEHFDRAQAVLSSLGSVVVHCGPVGAGQTTKACNQLIVMATLEAVAEALVLAQVAGVDPWRVREALLAGYASSPILELQGARMLRRDFVPGGKTAYHLKDISTIAKLASEAHIDLPAFNAAAGQIERLIDAGGADLDHSALITVLQRQRPSADADG